MIYTDCTNCGAGIVADEPNACILCGSPLCEHCYDESSYCKECQSKISTPIRQGECVECGRSCLRLSVNGSCEGCVMQAAMDAQEQESEN